jgi:uncharacterized membrane protein YdbT with pleckstrin-like domain
MTAYIETVRAPDERILQLGHLHWIIYQPVAAFALATVIAMMVAQSGLVALLLFVTAVMWLSCWITRLTTEIAVTDRRVIVKRGLIRRSTIEINANRIESVAIEQSIMGRLLNFGTLIVRGTGTGIEPIPRVAEPLMVRAAIGALNMPHA